MKLLGDLREAKREVVIRQLELDALTAAAAYSLEHPDDIWLLHVTNPRVRAILKLAGHRAANFEECATYQSFAQVRPSPRAQIPGEPRSACRLKLVGGFGSIHDRMKMRLRA